MEELSLWKMLEIIGNLILSSPFFLMTLIIGLIMVILMIISIRKYKKMLVKTNKYMIEYCRNTKDIGGD